MRCNLKSVIFKLVSRTAILSVSWEITRPHWLLVNIRSGNGLVPSSNKPLPEPKLIQICIAIWRRYVIMREVNSTSFLLSAFNLSAYLSVYLSVCINPSIQQSTLLLKRVSSKWLLRRQRLAIARISFIPSNFQGLAVRLQCNCTRSSFAFWWKLWRFEIDIPAMHYTISLRIQKENNVWFRVV